MSNVLYSYHAGYELHICRQEEGGSEVIGYDIYHRWEVTSCRPRVLEGEDCLLRVESRFGRFSSKMSDELEMCGVHIRFTQGEKLHVRFGVGTRGEYRFRVRGTGNGGNIYWEVIRFPQATVPHVFNWLRRQRLYSGSEWRDDFMGLWKQRQTITLSDLKAFSKQEVRSNLLAEAERCQCTVKQLIKLSSYEDPTIRTAAR